MRPRGMIDHIQRTCVNLIFFQKKKKKSLVFCFAYRVTIHHFLWNLNHLGSDLCASFLLHKRLRISHVGIVALRLLSDGIYILLCVLCIRKIVKLEHLFLCSLSTDWNSMLVSDATLTYKNESNKAAKRDQCFFLL